MTSLLRLRRRTLLAAGAAVVTLSAISTVGIAAATGGLNRHGAAAVSAGCVVPSLHGAVVTVTLADIRSMMGSGSMMGGGSMMSQHDWPRFRHGMMTVTAAPNAVPTGTVSLRVANSGYLTHELVVFPLTVGQQPGQRVAGSDGKVPETGSVGEASATCAPGAGEGITAGSVGWVTLTLAAGRYELACNLPGHYSAGMNTELDVR